MQPTILSPNLFFGQVSFPNLILRSSHNYQNITLQAILCRSNTICVRSGRECWSIKWMQLLSTMLRILLSTTARPFLSHICVGTIHLIVGLGPHICERGVVGGSVPRGVVGRIVPRLIDYQPKFIHTQYVAPKSMRIVPRMFFGSHLCRCG